VEFTCILCGYRSSDPGTCPRCGLPLLYKVRPIKPYKSNMPGVWRYSSVLPRPIRVVSLGEGFTRIRRVNDVVIKYEGNNPTGTYYDRGSAVLASLINGGEVKLTFEEDLTRSLALYLSTVGIETTVSVSYNVDPRDLLILAKLNVKVCVNCIDKPSIDYFNPLLIEGFKTTTTTTAVSTTTVTSVTTVVSSTLSTLTTTVTKLVTSTTYLAIAVVVTAIVVGLIVWAVMRR